MPDQIRADSAFKEANAPFTLNEITKRLILVYGQQVTYDRVHHAWREASQIESLASIVAPLPSKRRQKQFTCEGAKRIARRLASRLDVDSVQKPHNPALAPDEKQKVAAI